MVLLTLVKTIKSRIKTKMQTPNQQPGSRFTPPPSLPAGEPFRVSFSGSGIEVTARLTDPASADELIRSINALKLLLRPASENQKAG